MILYKPSNLTRHLGMLECQRLKIEVFKINKIVKTRPIENDS